MTEPLTDRPTGRCPLARRDLLRTATLAAATTLVGATGLAGCGGDEDEPAAGPDRTTGPVSAPPDAPAGTLARVADVPVGGGLLAEGGQVVVAQPTGGVFKAYDARCPHTGITVSPPGADGVIVCPGHRARFRAADGSVLTGPATRALSGVPVKVDDGYVIRVR